MDPDLLRKISPKDFYEAYLKEGLRPDGRKLHKTRPFVVNISEEDSSCVVRLGNTAVMCKLSEGTGFEGWSDLSYLGPAQGKVKITTIADDGNLIEAVALSYQLVTKQTQILFPFHFAELYGFYIRDPTKEEELLSKSCFTLFLSSTRVNVMKTQGSPIALSDVENLIETCRISLDAANKNLGLLKANKLFLGKLYSKRINEHP